MYIHVHVHPCVQYMYSSVIQYRSPTHYEMVYQAKEWYYCEKMHLHLHIGYVCYMYKGIQYVTLYMESTLIVMTHIMNN